MVELGDLSAIMRHEVNEGIVGQHGVPRRNEIHYWRCSQQELVVGKGVSRQQDVHKDIYKLYKFISRRHNTRHIHICYIAI